MLIFLTKWLKIMMFYRFLLKNGHENFCYKSEFLKIILMAIFSKNGIFHLFLLFFLSPSSARVHFPQNDVPYSDVKQKQLFVSHRQILLENMKNADLAELQPLKHFLYEKAKEKNAINKTTGIIADEHDFNNLFLGPKKSLG